MGTTFERVHRHVDTGGHRFRRTGLAAVLALGLSTIAVLAGGSPASATTTWTASGACGSVQTTTVPDGVYSMTVVVAGGNGGNGAGQSGGTTGSGGLGGRVTATFAVTPGDTISAVVGCNGADGDGGNSDIDTPSTAGWARGGGTGQGSNTAFNPNGAGGGAGGGASAVCLRTVCTAGSGTPLAVAGGAGGSGSSSCAGTTGEDGGAGGSFAGSTSAAGGSGPSGDTGGRGANSGIKDDGIPGGAGGVNSSGGSPNGGSSPDGSGGLGVNVVGGGGGGGFVGGGAGSNAATGCKAGAGGGGGSSWVRSTVQGTPIFEHGDGPQVTVTFANPVANAPLLGTPVPGDGQATLNWFPPGITQSPVTGIRVTPYVGGTPQPPRDYPASPNKQTITGLTNGVTYTFTVTAITQVGPGAASGQSKPVTVGVPANPALPRATTGDASALVQWWPAAPNGAPVTSYTVTPYIGNAAQTPQTFNSSATKQTVTGLTNGQTYTFRVEASNTFGTGKISGPTAPIVIGVPGTPAGQSATPGNRLAKVSWKAPAANGGPIQSYVITPYLGTNPQTPQTFDPGTTTQTITGLVNGGSYTFKVAATNAFGTSAQSAATGAIVVGAPDHPTFPRAVAGDGEATVTWNAGQSNGGPINFYTVIPLLDGVPQTPQTFTGSTTTRVVTGLTNGGTYKFQVSAANFYGSSTLSGASSPVVVGVPAKPTWPGATAGDGEATVKWVAPSGNGAPIEGYTITPYKDGVAQAPVTFNSTDHTQTLTGLTNGATYKFKIVAFNSFGDGVPSNLTAPVVPGLPGKPTWVRATSGDGEATVAWLAPSGNGSALQGYIITPFKDGVAQAPLTFNSTAQSQVISGLVNGATYTFKIVAFSGIGSGTVSNPTAPIIVGAPAAPAKPTATAGAGAATVQWVAPAANGSPVTGYVVVPYIGNAAQTPVVFASTATSQTVTGLTGGTAYTFKVAATNARGTGLTSPASAAVTPT